ncbi:MAG: efflux RND transporter periplasmic adaptor subunit [Planctomycetota bacterium]
MIRGILILLGATAVAAIWYASTRPANVEIATIERGTLRAVVEEEGKTKVTNRFVVSMPVAGRLQRLTLNEGDIVKRGDVLAEIDPLALRALIKEAEAQTRALERRTEGIETKKPKREELESARVGEQSAKEALTVSMHLLEDAKAAAAHFEQEAVRERKLAERGIATDSTLGEAEMRDRQGRERVAIQEIRVKIRRYESDTATLRRGALEAQVHDFDWQEKDYQEQIAGIRAGLEKLRDDLTKARVLAPADGVVLRRLKESEQVLAAGTALLEIGSLDQLEVEADFLSEDVAHMKAGMDAEIFGRALGSRVVAAKIRRIYPSAFLKISSLGVEQQRVTVILAPTEPLGGANPTSVGDRFRVEARVVLERRADVVLVPEGALFRSANKWHVFRVQGGTVRAVEVGTGIRDGRRREVTSGLNAGDEVVLHPGPDLQDGDRVVALD